eukprot:CAMPEP_0172429364 /NCGR_PEP_ID=MMETSP1064-20121228/50058_1 /TAXON_ID=202472 /ORGANISM="Aulacoseira subarctica , Strain CCAP 1002/5" /LENGTH=516 /DNA_ID=CAMNT_0013174721 /DNA_START=162 /DNA_END=1712 /DNA_ORIENTATION=+
MAKSPRKLLSSKSSSGEFPVSSNAHHGKKRLTENTINPLLKHMEYAVRGKVVLAADQISRELKSPEYMQKSKKYNFDKILYTNIGNPQSVGQAPLQWPRQVMALVNLPDSHGINHPVAKQLFPQDAIDRAREIKTELGGHSIGAYSLSKGTLCFRKDIADFIKARDGGFETDPEDIFMTNGASTAIRMIMTALAHDPKCGTMIPIPQYPIYSATCELLGLHQVGYYLDESEGWDLTMGELERSLEEAKAHDINVNSFVLINPGNPTGQVLSEESVKDVCRFCSKHNLVLLADEVYQENVYDKNASFYSCKRAASELGMISDDTIELVSFHSTSKGLFGECGRRGGYMELAGFDSQVKDYLYKLASSGLCSSLDGQVMTSLMVRGPSPGSTSYESHQMEMKEIYESLKRRSKTVSQGLNSIPGFSCQPSQGSMYCFPSIQLPSGARTAAKNEGIAPDTFYAIDLLQETGICVVPASGFQQKEGRFGFRTTFLPPENEMEDAVRAIAKHYLEFCSKYS